MADTTLAVVVKEIIDAANGIKVYELVRDNGRNVPFFTAGSHIDVATPAGIVRQYSICSDPNNSASYQIAILDEPDSRGGSSSMHRDIRAGDPLSISRPRNNFPLEDDAEEHVLIAGGIGITPMLAMVQRLQAIEANYHLHYCTKDPSVTAFKEFLETSPFDEHVTFHHDGGDISRGMDITSTLATARPGRHVYCCGPAGLMAAVKSATEHWPLGHVHFEYFSGDPDALSAEASDFEIEIASSGAVFLVPADKSILDVLRENDIDVDSACEEGVCGTCATGLLGGEGDHRDMVLSDQDKAQNSYITVCCSRAKSARLKLDL